MPTLEEACKVIARIFDPTLPMRLFLPSNSDILFTIVGVTMLLLKDFFDEYHPNRLIIFDNNKTYIRWGAYISVFIMIMLMGVFGADQFIYVNF